MTIQAVHHGLEGRAATRCCTLGIARKSRLWRTRKTFISIAKALIRRLDLSVSNWSAASVDH
jgi:hypothetical protein